MSAASCCLIYARQLNVANHLLRALELVVLPKQLFLEELVPWEFCQNPPRLASAIAGALRSPRFAIRYLRAYRSPRGGIDAQCRTYNITPQNAMSMSRAPSLA